MEASRDAGTVAPGFEAVADEFARNFSERGEVGAAFAVSRGGEPLVDLWGGVSDPATVAPWQPDTIQVIFSGSKGLTALCMVMLADRGALALDARVAEYWPEFAAAGKAEITVAEVLSHRARLPGMRTPLGEDDLLDPVRMAALLAAQEPEADPRAALLYHALTFAWLCDGLVRRVDGRSVGEFFAAEVAAPLELEIWIGLAPELEPRVARLVYSPSWGKSEIAQEDPFPGDDLWASIYQNPPLFPPHEVLWNRPGWHRAELAGSNAIGSARSLAELYGVLACGGTVGDVELLSSAALQQATQPLADGTDPYDGSRQLFGAGFYLQTEERPYGPVAEAFGHPGAGGTTHGAWPEHRIGFSYATNEMRDDPAGDDRAAALLQALHGCVTAECEG